MTRAVDETGLEVAFGCDDRLCGLAQVRDVVERIVEPEDVDPVLRRRGDEAPREVGVDRPRADEEAAAQRQTERGLDAGLERADALPRALDPALDGGVEATAAGDLEVREPRPVEDLGKPELLGGRHPPGKRLLSEQADRRIGQRRHGGTLPRLHGFPRQLGAWSYVARRARLALKNASARGLAFPFTVTVTVKEREPGLRHASGW